MEHPVLAIEEKERNAVALISDCKDQNNHHVLLVLKLEVKVRGVIVNEIVSLYGRNNLDIYIAKHDMKDIHVIDDKKARQLSRDYGLQLSTALKVPDSDKNALLPDKNVKQNLPADQKQKESLLADFMKNRKLLPGVKVQAEKMIQIGQYITETKERAYEKNIFRMDQESKNCHD